MVSSSQQSTGKRTCMMCSSPNFILHFKARSTEVPRAYRITEEHLATCWDIVRCASCGLIVSDWHFSEDELHGLYRDMEDNLYDEEDLCRKLTFRRCLTLIDSYFTHAAEPLSSIPKLLDVGCATGLLLQEALSRGWEVEGVDLCDWAVKRAALHGIHSVHKGTIYTYSGTENFFDIVTMLDFIEHDPDPAALLDRVHVLLRRGGLLYITTPDIAGGIAKILGSKWWGINPLHLTYFSRYTLPKLLKKHGFTPLIVRTYARTFTCGYWATRLEHFHPLLASMATTFIRCIGLWNMPLRINLRDMMEVVAVKN